MFYNAEFLCAWPELQMKLKSALLAYFPYFEKNKRCCLCVCISLIVARQRFGKSPLFVARQWLGKNPLIVSRQRLGKNPPIFARQRLGRYFNAVTNTHATIEELLDASFSMWPVSYQGKWAISSSQNFLL
jgi:hypothetical protein